MCVPYATGLEGTRSCAASAGSLYERTVESRGKRASGRSNPSSLLGARRCDVTLTQAGVAVPPRLRISRAIACPTALFACAATVAFAAFAHMRGAAFARARAITLAAFACTNAAASACGAAIAFAALFVLPSDPVSSAIATVLVRWVDFHAGLPRMPLTLARNHIV